MNLVNFLGWEDSNGIYRSETNGQFYRVVDDKLETFVFEISEWRESNIRINKLYKLKPMEKVGAWSEGFKVQNKREWEAVKSYYLKKGYEIYKSAVLRAAEYLENGTVFYAFIYYGKVEITTSEELVKRDLILKPINWQIEFDARYAGRVKLNPETYWQRNANLDTVSLFQKEYVAIWHGTDMSDSKKD